MALGRATETVQQCRDYLASTKDTSIQQVGPVLAGGRAAATATAAAEQLEEPEEQPCPSIDQAVENIERNRFGSVKFAGFPADADEEEEELVVEGDFSSRQVTPV